jgi:ATP-independent RNA helicase DbpA
MNQHPYPTHLALQRLAISQLNPMQEKTISSADSNSEIILLSETGSGKTLAFLISILNRIDWNQKGKIQALILAPTRELVLQTESVLRKLQVPGKISACYGGHKREIEENNLIEPPTILLATTGRLADHIRRKNLTLEHVHSAILDEYDKILELDFQEEMGFILPQIPENAFKILTSATELPEIPDFVGLKSPIILNFLSDNPVPPEKCPVYLIKSDNPDKLDTLLHLIAQVKNTSSIVFCNHRDAVERTHNWLKEQGIVSVFYHGGMDQMPREVALCKFKNGTSNILVTTDLAARGLDIPYVRNIIHYHLPHQEDQYIHRNGRTARMNETGSIFILLASDEILPEYMRKDAQELDLQEEWSMPEKPKWSTLFIAAGKKSKINKIDVVGYLTQKAGLKKDDIGLIEVKDHTTYVGIRKSKISLAVEAAKLHKIKNQRVRMEVAK